MDLASLVSNKPLLASLSREYELLKSTQGEQQHTHALHDALQILAQYGASLTLDTLLFSCS
jgi:hypothetical protein